MKFFDREKEIKTLQEISERSKTTAQFTVITGRRRIGKTSMVLKAHEESKIVYLFVGRKSETLLCDEFRFEVEKKLNVRMGGTPRNFSELFEYLMVLSKERNFTLFIDEFQNFERVNPSIFSDMQKIWDLNQTSSKINLIVCGSIYSMMTKIFRDNKEPLYNRQNRFMKVKPFRPSVLKDILEEYSPGYVKDDLLALYTFTGGVAKYIQLLIDSGAYTRDRMIDEIVSEDSVFINEGRSILIEEFGKDYDTYFSILSSIASGNTRRGEIETSIGKSVGGFLARLEDDYGIISRELPIGAKPLSKNTIFTIKDNFILFWFRFIFKYAHFIEIGAYEQLRRVIKRDYTTFSGLTLERYFRAKAIESQNYTLIGRWWDSKGENELDLVAANELDKNVDIFEVKRKRKNINFNLLIDKKNKLLSSTDLFKGYDVRVLGVDMEDM
ncbi:MAG: ATP-binding protein [Muribaculaceae bacterium]|nr:ATP-binding protein [Muribaculaceae bacterium]